MPGPGRPPPNQTQNLISALKTFRGLSLFALAVSLGVGAILLARAQTLDRFVLASWAFWAIAIFSLVAGYGLGAKLVRALTHRQRWRHAMPWLAIILVTMAASWGVGALVAKYLGPGQPLYGPVAMAFGLVVSWVEFHRPGPSLDG